jgi:hypothetical protein
LKSPAEKAGFEQGFKITGIETLADRPAKEWLYLPAFLLVAAIFGLQRLRPEDTPTGRAAILPSPTKPS